MKRGKAVSQEKVACGVVESRKQQAEFVRRGLAAIHDTQREGTGIPVEQVVARLEAKLTTAWHTFARRS